MRSTKEDRPRHALAAGLLLATVALAGCMDGSAPPTNTFDREASIAPGGFFEANLAMDESAEIVYRWSTSPETTVGFDVHSHAGDEVRHHEQASAASGQGAFTAPEEGTFSLMWENPAEDPVEVTIHVEGAFELVSEAP